jgi:hypothetical protein
VRLWTTIPQREAVRIEYLRLSTGTPESACGVACQIEYSSESFSRHGVPKGELEVPNLQSARETTAAAAAVAAATAATPLSLSTAARSQPTSPTRDEAEVIPERRS